MSVKHNSEPTVTATSPAPIPSFSTNVFEEWNFQDENAAGNHTVLDGKIIARMPDLGTAPSINQTNDDNEPGAAELFRKAFAAVLRGNKKKMSAAESKKQLYRRLSAAGIAVLICGAGLLFLEKNESAKDAAGDTTADSTAAVEESFAAAAQSAAAARTASEVPVVVVPAAEISEKQPEVRPPAADVFPVAAAAAGTTEAMYPPNNPFERPPAAANPMEGGQANAAMQDAAMPNTAPNANNTGVAMYPIPSQDNVAAAVPVVYPAANYQAGYQGNYPANAAAAYYPAQDRLDNNTASAYPAAAPVQNRNTVPAGYYTGQNTERQPYNAAPQYNVPPQYSGNNNMPNNASNAGYPYAAPQTQGGSYLQSAGRAVAPPYPQGYQQGNVYPNGGNSQTNVPIPESSPYPPPMPPQYQSAPYQQVPYQQTPQVSQPNYPYDYPSHRKVY